MPLDLKEMLSEKISSENDHAWNDYNLIPETLISRFFQDVDNQNRWVDRFTKEHPSFVLVKSGRKALTSVRPGKLRALIELVSIKSQRIKSGESLTLTVKIHNIGDTLWFAEPREYGGFVRLGAKLHDSAGRLISHYLEGANLPEDLAPGAMIEIAYAIPLQNFKPGNYILSLDMVDEQVCWFQDRGSQVLSMPIEIKPEFQR